MTKRRLRRIIFSQVCKETVSGRTSSYREGPWHIKTECSVSKVEPVCLTYFQGIVAKRFVTNPVKGIHRLHIASFVKVSTECFIHRKLSFKDVMTVRRVGHIEPKSHGHQVILPCTATIGHIIVDAVDRRSKVYTPFNIVICRLCIDLADFNFEPVNLLLQLCNFFFCRCTKCKSSCHKQPHTKHFFHVYSF